MGLKCFCRNSILIFCNRLLIADCCTWQFVQCAVYITVITNGSISERASECNLYTLVSSLIVGVEISY